MMQTNTTQGQPKKLLDQVREKIRFKHYSLSTENTYLSWIKQFILYHSKRHPADMGAAEVESFLTYLATQRQVSSSTQNQALSAILFCIARCWQSLCRGWIVLSVRKTASLVSGFNGPGNAGVDAESGDCPGSGQPDYQAVVRNRDALDGGVRLRVKGECS
jgi:hypothetical protein